MRINLIIVSRMDFKYQRNRIDKLPHSKLVAELVRVALAHGLEEFGKREFDETARVSSSSVVREFGTWSKAIEHLRQELTQQGKTLRKKHRGYFTEAEAFAELERIWKEIGHRPSRIEWENSEPSISYNTYTRYFGGWSNACLKFLESRSIASPAKPTAQFSQPSAKDTRKKELQSLASRSIPPGLRLRVYERDRFRCVFCGRSPISDLTVQLHLDHKHPFAGGGPTVLENLQKLCSLCNIGKSDRADVALPHG
jgi:5-methylcytosine-specific restriction endonuclease McrA